MSKETRSRLIFLILETTIVAVCLSLFLWFYSRNYTEYQEVTVTVISKDTNRQLVSNNSSGINTIRINYYVTVCYKNVNVIVNNKKLYNNSTINKDIDLTLCSRHEHGELISQELIYPYKKVPSRL